MQANKKKPVYEHNKNNSWKKFSLNYKKVTQPALSGSDILNSRSVSISWVYLRRQLIWNYEKRVIEV